MQSTYHTFVLAAICAAALSACGGGDDNNVAASSGGGNTAPATPTSPAAPTTPDAPTTPAAPTTPTQPSTPTSPANPSTPSSVNVAEYVGTWIGDTSVCKSGFAYGNYYYRLTSLQLTDTTAENTYTAYSDVGCTSKAGQVIERFNVKWTGGSVAGKTNVARATLVFTGSTTGRDGGSGITLNKVPNGALVANGGKLLLDVDANGLFDAPASAPLDADGFPTMLNPSAFATKQP